MPAGAYAGDAGWLVNDAARALFSNRRAPDGPTGVMRAVFATGRRVKLTTKSLGDAGALALSAAPDTAVEIAWVVTNGAETRTHCASFAPARCAWIPLDGGAGWKLRCDGGVADLACGAKSTCGNGIREPGEECDGGALCTAECRQGMASCCQGAGQCIAAPAFSLQYYLMQYCSGYGTPVAGQVCRVDGSCADEGIDPVPVCCQEETTCYQQSASSVAQLWYDQYYCLAGSGIGGPRHIVINGTCGGDGSCVPN
jgi:hypothetical protein